jgi:hypothetical protein
MTNELRIALGDFKLAMRRFRAYRRLKKVPDALLAFNNGMLSFEAGEDVAVVHADGEWHGRAWVNAYYLGLLHKVAPREDPVVISYADGKLHISTLSLGCEWEVVSARMIARVENPSVLDLLAMDRTVPRAEIHGTDLGKRIAQAKSTAGNSVTRAAKLLEKVGISADDLWAMVEAQIKARMSPGA